MNRVRTACLSAWVMAVPDDGLGPGRGSAREGHRRAQAGAIQAFRDRGTRQRAADTQTCRGADAERPNLRRFRIEMQRRLSTPSIELAHLLQAYRQTGGSLRLQIWTDG